LVSCPQEFLSIKFDLHQKQFSDIVYFFRCQTVEPETLS
jgi:hypothetical protein